MTPLMPQQDMARVNRGLWRVRRQKHGENTADAGRAFDMQPAMMAVQDMLDDGQPQAGALLFGREEWIEYLRKLLFGEDARSIDRRKTDGRMDRRAESLV
jgi:chromosome condensin MukBEF ATPase and DNA-binding subunit MukB